MTLQIYVRSNRVYKVQNDLVSATTINATGSIVYYFDAQQEPRLYAKDILTTANGNFVTATAASATIEGYTDSVVVLRTLTPTVTA